MPRTVVDLSAPRVAFNDEPLLSAEIWRSAQAIAQAPMQLRQIRMAEDERDMQHRERGARMLHMQNQDARQVEQDRIALEDRTYNRERQGRLDTEASQDREYHREQARRRNELLENKMALDAESDQAKAAAKTPGGRLDEKRYATILKMADESDVVPHPGEDESAFARRVEEASAVRRNRTPRISVKEAGDMIPELQRVYMPAEDIAAEAQRIASASTPAAGAGRALGAARAASPEDFNIPTLREALDPSAAPAPAAPVAAPAPASTGQMIQAADPVSDEVARIPRGGLAAHMAELSVRDPDLHDKVAAMVGWKNLAPRKPADATTRMGDIMARTPGFGGYGPGQPR